MSPLVDALSGNWYWGMSLCEFNCTQVPLQVIIFIVESCSTKAILEMELGFSKHIPEVCNMYSCVSV